MIAGIRIECFKKWDTFNEEAGTIVTGATITQLAKENGWVSQSGYDSENAHELGWTDTIDRDYRVIDKDWIEARKSTSRLFGIQFRKSSNTLKHFLKLAKM